MQARDQYFSRPVRQTVVATGVESYSFLLNARTRAIVGPIVKGDFKKPNPWRYNIDMREGPKGIVQSFNAPGGGILTEYREGACFNGTLEDAQVPPPDDEPELYNQALDNLYEKVRGGLDLSVDIAEMGQVKKMLQTTLSFEKGLMGSYNYLGSLPAFRGWRRGGKVALDLAKKLGDTWLEWQYGWKPLINTIYQAADEAVRYVNNEVSTFRAGAVHKYDGTVRRGVAINGEGYPCTVKYSGREFFYFECDFRNYDNDLSRWTSLNPVSLAWELMPYSFVVDWVYNVGGYLRNLETALLYDARFVRGILKEGYFWDGEYKIPYHRNSASYVALLNVMASRSIRAYRRSVLLSAPLPRAPSFKADLGASRLLSAAALLSQLVDPLSQPRPQRETRGKHHIWPKGRDFW